MQTISPLTLKALCAWLLVNCSSVQKNWHSEPGFVKHPSHSNFLALLQKRLRQQPLKLIIACNSLGMPFYQDARMLKSTSTSCLLKLCLMQFNLNWFFLLMQTDADDHLFTSLFNLAPEISILNFHCKSLRILLDQFYFGFSSCDSHLVIKLLSWLFKTISVPTVQQLLSCVDSIYNAPLSYMPLNYDSVLATYSKTVGILKSDVPLVLLIISSPSLRVWPKFGDFFYVDIQCFRELQIQLHSLVNLLIPSITLVALCTIPCHQCYIIGGKNLASNEALLVLFPPIVLALK